MAYNQQHEVFQDAFKMAVAWNGDGAVDDRADKRPDEAGDHLAVGCHDLQTECQAVDVGAVVRNDAQREYHEAKISKTAQRSLQHRT